MAFSLWTGSRFFWGKKIAKGKESSPVPRSTKDLSTGYMTFLKTMQLSGSFSNFKGRDTAFQRWTLLTVAIGVFYILFRSGNYILISDFSKSEAAKAAKR